MAYDCRDLFTPAFMSVWTELTEKQQNDITDNLLKALETSQHPDVIQTILNLAEFMDHSEKVREESKVEMTFIGTETRRTSLIGYSDENKWNF